MCRRFAIYLPGVVNGVYPVWVVSQSVQIDCFVNRIDRAATQKMAKTVTY